MKIYYLFLFSILLSCNQQQSQAEKEYIKNLETKNRQLENDLQAERNKPPVVIERQADPIYVPTESAQTSNSTRKNYFKIGSSENQVLDVMGDPDQINEFETMDEKWFHYGMSKVVFKSGRVKTYNNFDGNLKVKVRD